MLIIMQLFKPSTSSSLHQKHEHLTQLAFFPRHGWLPRDQEPIFHPRIHKHHLQYRLKPVL